MKRIHRCAVGLLAVVVAMALGLPALSFANPQEAESSSGATGEANPTVSVESSGSGSLMEEPVIEGDLPGGVVSGDTTEAPGGATETPGGATETPGDATETPAGDCVLTVKYYENVNHPEPGIPPDANGRYLLGTRTVTGLTEGDVVDAWDYVVNIKGFFFFDGWPGKVTISADPADNLIELFYFRLHNSSYTVNYYLMEGADLTADTWSEALAPEDVEFVKLGSQVFENQPYGVLVEGDVYEYQLDGAYVVDSYPPQIRVGTDADNNAINVLYVPASTRLPDDVIVEGVVPPDGSGGAGGGSGSVVKPGGSGGATGPGGATTPGATTPPSETPTVPDTPEAGGSGGVGDAGAGGSGTGGSGDQGGGVDSSVTIPGDQTFTRDELLAILPSGSTQEQATVLLRDFAGAVAAENELEITDEMLSDPVDPAVAREVRAAYETGLAEGKAAQPGGCSLVDHILCIILIVVLLILAIVGYCLYFRERRRNEELRQAAQEAQPAEGADADASTRVGR